jgi:lysyl-tRNA synthetase class II
VDDRRAKLERLRAQGIDPFPHQFPGVQPTSAVVDDMEPGEETDRAYRVAGRITGRRDQGGAAFIDLAGPRRQDPAARQARRCSARTRSTASSHSTSAT